MFSASKNTISDRGATLSDLRNTIEQNTSRGQQWRSEDKNKKIAFHLKK